MLSSEQKRLTPTAMHVGAGTILSPADARASIDAGAEFIVTPTLQIETIALCREAGVPIVCGAYTPTEALAAHRAGADFIKLFPADSLGPDFVRAILAPLPFLKIMPTGGITLDNIAAYFHAGCVGVGVGGNLLGKRHLREGNWPALAAEARRYVETVAAAKHQR